MRLTVISHLTLDGVIQSNGKPEPEQTLDEPYINSSKGAP